MKDQDIKQIVWRDCQQERRRQEKMYAGLSRHALEWLAIVDKTKGKLAQETLNMHFEGNIHAIDVYRELTQVTASALAWMEDMRRIHGDRLDAS